jgi:cytochrome oxidase Cu insertion factor (SCO1/SenC/PrrC family)
VVDRDARTRITVALVGSLFVAACLLAMPPSAHADGDPASDLLQTQTIFLPADANAGGEQSLALSQLLRAADRGGVETRVAVIASDYDLGSVNALWRKPRLYARFLGTELSGAYAQRLLVVMPDGFGFSWPGHSTARIYRLLARIRLGPGGTSLLADADAGVRAVAAAAGVALTLPAAGRRAAPRAPASNGSAAGKLAIVAILTVTILATLLGIFGRRLRELAGGLRAAGVRRTPGTWSVVRERRRIAGIAALVVLIATAGVVLGTRLRQTATPTAAAVPFTWPAERRPAPAFRLTDQNGEPVSLASYRGRPVIITFVDPLCRNFCPLAAHVLNQVDRDMPPARRPAIIAVSVDIYADTHADLMQDYSRWGLVPQWHWAVGSPDALAAVWKRYEVGVSVKNKRIAGTTVHFVTHDELAYVIDPNGDERALFYWPYAPQDVERTLHRLAS